MPLPYVENPALLDEQTLGEMDGQVARLNGYLSAQHGNDGEHTAITADSLTINTGGSVTLNITTAATATAGAGAAVAPEKFLPITVNGISYKLALFLP